MTPHIKKKSDKWIPWYFVAFFAGLAILNVIFIIIAVSTHRGVVTENAYEKGINYNKTIAEAQRQEELGWKGDINFNRSALSFTLKDSSGNFIADADVAAYLFRVAEAGSDFTLPLAYVGNGRYYTDIIFPFKGQWDIRIIAKWQEQKYQQTRRIVVKQYPLQNR